MFEISGTKITLTRGDYAAVELAITRELADGTKEPFVLDSGDKLVLTAKKNLCELTQIALRLTSYESALFVIRPEDTKEMEPGTYVYDVELQPGPYTLIGPAEMEILPEVTV